MHGARDAPPLHTQSVPKSYTTGVDFCIERGKYVTAWQHERRDGTRRTRGEKGPAVLR